MRYEVTRTNGNPALDLNWDGPLWKNIPAADIASAHPLSESTHPATQVKLQYSDAGIYVCFRVHDQYVRAHHTGYQKMVCEDSCVEFFVQPPDQYYYFAFEMNCTGALLADYVLEPYKRKQPISDHWLNQIQIQSTLKGPIEQEITEPVTWAVAYFVPWTLFAVYAGANLATAPRPGTTWHANFYKCADQTTHPHWISWKSIGELRAFHQPDLFGDLLFA
jgi:hypothetical protein